jgi:hypothetical protein
MRTWGVVVAGLILFAGACSESTHEEQGGGGMGPSAGTSGEAGNTADGGGAPDDGVGGVHDLPNGAAGSAAAGESSAGDGSVGLGGCDGAYDELSETGSIVGSTSRLAELVGSWTYVFNPDDDETDTWTINADGTASNTLRRVIPTTSTTVESGTIRFGVFALVLDVNTITVTTASGTETSTVSEELPQLYRYYASSHPNTLLLGPPDCGILSLDPFERE